MASYIDSVLCGRCDSELMLGSVSVTIQTYRDRPSVRHFWVYCNWCEGHKLYWPTPLQIVVADALDCPMLTDDTPPDEVLRSYERDGSAVRDEVEPLGRASSEITFLVNMLAVMSAPCRHEPPQASYLPALWSN